MGLGGGGKFRHGVWIWQNSKFVLISFIFINLACEQSLVSSKISVEERNTGIRGREPLNFRRCATRGSHVTLARSLVFRSSPCIEGERLFAVYDKSSAVKCNVTAKNSAVLRISSKTSVSRFSLIWLCLVFLQVRSSDMEWHLDTALWMQHQKRPLQCDDNFKMSLQSSQAVCVSKKKN